MKAPFCVWWQTCPSCDGRGWEPVYREPGRFWTVTDCEDAPDLQGECLECSGLTGWIDTDRLQLGRAGVCAR